MLRPVLQHRSLSQYLHYRRHLQHPFHACSIPVPIPAACIVESADHPLAIHRDSRTWHNTRTYPEEEPHICSFVLDTAISKVTLPHSLSDRRSLTASASLSVAWCKVSVVKREVKCEEDETAIGSAKERLRGVGNCSSGIRESGLNDPAAQRLSLTLASPACLFLSTHSQVEVTALRKGKHSRSAAPPSLRSPRQWRYSIL